MECLDSPSTLRDCFVITQYARPHPKPSQRTRAPCQHSRTRRQLALAFLGVTAVLVYFSATKTWQRRPWRKGNMYRLIGGDQKEYGPVSADEVRLWITQRRLQASSLVQAEGTTDWK